MNLTERHYFSLKDPNDIKNDASCYLDCELIGNKRIIGDYGQLIYEGTKIVMCIKPSWLTPELLKQQASTIVFNESVKKNQGKGLSKKSP